MKQFTRILLTLALAGALLCGGALAAEDGSLTVQLDGRELTFTDAQPQMQAGRTFLPFRTLFETMGAEVSYDAETCVVTAVRGDRTITMTLGSNELTITEGDKSETVIMDVVPYVDTATWRTYVPVRFAAQALDCAVGWEQSNYTVIIVDTEKLVAETLAGKSFTYLEKLMAFSEKYDKGIWDMKADMGMAMSLFGMPLLTMEGKIQGTTQDADKLAMDVSMKLDMSGMEAMGAMASGLTGALGIEDQTALKALAADGMTLAVRMDRAAGTAYMNMDPTSNVWYRMDATQAAGTSLTDAMAMGKLSDMVKSLTAALGGTELTDSSKAYPDMKAKAEALCAALADESFQLGENGVYTTTYSAENGETATEFYVALAMTGETVTAYEIGVATKEEAATTTVVMGMNADGRMQMEMVQVSGGGMIASDLVMEGSYAPGTTAPNTQPPAGAEIQDMEEDADALMGLLPFSMGA